ncbi:hypothetical protein DQ226_13600 [Dietzia maris]|uniref:Very short patch repair endonuclease n=1 Tax=Dietzia maris TaxID=37915 RepID=A0A365P800_9ACTN|nr:hypothetical protein DQ226_13600 [Dietzia maris]
MLGELTAHLRVSTRAGTVHIVFPKAKIAVFVDGCYWHGCREHYRPSRANAEFWAAKIESNRDRDERTNEKLREAGWTALRYWEHEPPDAVAQSIANVFERARNGRR